MDQRVIKDRWIHTTSQNDFSIAIIVHYIVAEIAGMYRSWQGVSDNREAYLKLSTWGLAFLLVAGIGFTTNRLEEYSRLLLSVWLLGTALVMVLGDGLLKSLQRSYWLRGLNTKHCAIVGVTDLGIQLARNIFATPELGLKLAGYGLLGKDRAFPDSGIAKLDGIALTRDWRRYRVPLEGLDLAAIRTGFVVTLTGRATPVTVYLDSIRFVR